MEETVRYTYRIRPGVTAERLLLDEWNRCRFLWNEAVFQQKSGRGPTFGSLSAMLTKARSTTEWLRAGSQVAQQQTLRTYSQALNQSQIRKGRGRPKYKSRKLSKPSMEYTQRGFAIRDGRLTISKGIVVPVVWSRELPSTPTSVRVFLDSVGHWYASFVVRREAEVAPPVSGGIGIDWGVATTATTSVPVLDLHYLGHRKRSQSELAKSQRRMARRHRKSGNQSNGYRRARSATAQLHKKAQRQTAHDTRVWAKRVVETKSLIAVEDFKPKFLAKSTLARKSADAAIGTAKRELIERAVRAGRTVVMVKPAYTTMTCSSCFARAKQQLGLAERIFLCRDCGHTDSRDRNAARVILAVAERGHTSVDDVRHLQPSSGSVVRAI